ncbi:hypothetical protein UFOVP1174_6 [uncultured Caudovirales phage]|jgi:hypothetical protein|uniref:Uncharacterized protein n=1 Tax=uncultured Caudovirales phage TaxID=2100421 RepID=A0A6J5QUH7_9CAUD|nr:hypothetical protein UFOVP1174_6 [uncultured Caudovirales phage]
MALGQAKILVAGAVTNTAGAYFQTTTVAAVTSGNGTVVTAGTYQMNAQANVSIVMYDGSAWGTLIGNNTGGTFSSDGTNVGAKAVNANTTATLITINGGQNVSGTYNS